MKTRNVGRLVAEVVAIVGAVVLLVLYLVTSTTGYLAGAATSAWPWILAVLAIILLGTDVLIGARLPGLVRDLLVMGSLGSLLIAFAQVVLARASLVADVVFNPVNTPEAEKVAMNLSIMAILGCLIAVIALIVAAFMSRNRISATRVVEGGAVA
ncbi:hypothetical protein U6G28_04535 [Actinomycetaceae bacterium MB13-C1-2]|nr:hypothetical protein U6G28_04535 [Actinomycetaceae bacterium MB13-C1-2]